MDQPQTQGTGFERRRHIRLPTVLPARLVSADGQPFNGTTNAELAYLQDRRQAFENLGLRTNHSGVKAVATALIQAERYGTPLGQALRVMAKENRDMRMSTAEKKAAALPAKLTVPMILFFLPVLFVVILGPAAISFQNL